MKMMMKSNDKGIKELTPEQMKCVDFKSGDLLIKGVPGSGKSYVIMKRAIKLKEKHPNSKVMVLTFANSLVKYTDELLRDYNDKNAIEVMTVDKYCTDLYRVITKKRCFSSSDDKYTELIKKSMSDAKTFSNNKHRLLNEKNIDFLKDEINWIREKCILNRTDYHKSDRRGRGATIRLSVSDKDVMWDIYSHFRVNCEAQKYSDLREMYLELNMMLDSFPEKYKIDYILVDEAQDLTIGKMRVLKALATKSITISADFAQKIYNTTFTWKEVGIDISGNSSKSLTKSFRSTKQIVMLAESLIERNRMDPVHRDEYTNAILPESEGPLPVLYECDTNMDKDAIIRETLRMLIRTGDTIGVMYRTYEDCKPLTSLLRSSGIPFEFIKKGSEWSLLKPGIKIVSAHSSKGLEFDTVIIPNLEDNIYPYNPFNIDSEEIDNVLEIDRKLLYVAMTRARKSLYMFCNRSNKSRFISEIKSSLYEKCTFSSRNSGFIKI